MSTSWASLSPELFVSESEFPHPAKEVTTSNTPMMERILLLNICRFLLKIWSEKTVGRRSGVLAGCGSMHYFIPISLSPGEFLRLVSCKKMKNHFFTTYYLSYFVILLKMIWSEKLLQKAQVYWHLD
jgi:hypothetical protein